MLRTRSQATATDARVEALTKENKRLRELLAERASAGASKSGYLMKYRGHATSSLWAPTWEARYVIVKGDTLSYFKSERDVHYPPRGEIDLQGTYLELEGLKRRKYWTFQVVDSNGVSLIRLSTEAQGEYYAWADVLERAGCVKRSEDDASSQGGAQRATSQTSPANSGISDSDAATYRERTSPTPEPPTSARMQQLQEQDEAESHPQGRGYTSDQSDVVRHAHRRKHGGQREAMVGSTPVHSAPRASLLSSERIVISNQSGLVTLVFIILAATNFRLILENILKYGLRFNPFTFVRKAVTPSGNLPLLLCWPALLLYTLAALGIENLALKLLRAEQKAATAYRKKGIAHTTAKRRITANALISENFILLLNFINTTAVLVVPSAVIHYTWADPLPGFALTMVVAILWLKLVSYAHVNWDYRMARRKGELRAGERGSEHVPAGIHYPLQYPENITLGNLLYFLVAPTLCYQPAYPRSTRFRLRWMLRRLVMFGAALGMMLFLMEQYIEPTIDNSLRPLRQMDWLRMSERVLKLSVPTLYFWLAMFYALFDLWLNVIGELTLFGDREFYKEWWNATTVGEYWRLWNMPVHKWMLRHVYFPAIRHNVPKFWAGVLVFFVSAVFHEVLVGVPLHMVRMWSFWGIMAQVPLMVISELLKRRFQSDRVGNVIFWVSFCFLGQPLSLILYYHDWRKLNGLLGGPG